MSALKRMLAGVVTVAWLGAGLVAAQDRDEGKKTDLQVWAIRATTKNKDVSPELRDIADKLKKQFKYTGYKLEKRASGSAAIGKDFTADLIGGYSTKITPKRYDGKKVTLQVVLLKGKESKLDTTVTLNAREFTLIGGPALDGGDVLILAVSGK